MILTKTIKKILMIIRSQKKPTLTNNKKFAKIGVIIIIITLWDKIFRIEKNVDV